MTTIAQPHAGITPASNTINALASVWPRLDAVNDGGRLECAVRAIELVGHALTAGDAARQSGALAMLLSNAARDIREAAERFDDVVEVLGELALT